MEEHQKGLKVSSISWSKALLIVKKFGACTFSVEVVLSHSFTTSDSGILEKNMIDQGVNDGTHHW